MPVFDFPAGLSVVAHFSIPKVKTWGSNHLQYREIVRQAAGLPEGAGRGYAWFVFVIRCVVGRSRGRVKNQIPDVENIPKLIVDAFTGVLYQDDNINYVRGVQVEAEWGTDHEERTDVWIFGFPQG